jgi:hypothetical protein
MLSWVLENIDAGLAEIGARDQVEVAVVVDIGDADAHDATGRCGHALARGIGDTVAVDRDGGRGIGRRLTAAVERHRVVGKLGKLHARKRVGAVGFVPCAVVGHREGPVPVVGDRVIGAVAGEDCGVIALTAIEHVVTAAARHIVVVRKAGEDVGASAADKVDLVARKQIGEIRDVATHQVPHQRVDRIARAGLIDKSEPRNFQLELRQLEVGRVGQAIAERDRIEIASDDVGEEFIVERRSLAARVHEHALLGRIRKQIRLFGGRELVTGIISRVRTKPPKSVASERHVEASKIGPYINPAAVTVRIIGGNRYCHSYSPMRTVTQKLAETTLLRGRGREGYERYCNII